jgi:hypothetical protein
MKVKYKGPVTVEKRIKFLKAQLKKSTSTEQKNFIKLQLKGLKIDNDVNTIWF